MSAKSKSSLSGTPNTKSSPATPRRTVPKLVPKPSGDSVSSLQNGRLSIDRSPGSVTSKPKIPSPRVTTPTEKKITRLVRPSSELQAELSQAQEDLKKANEKLVLVEKEKANAFEEVKEAKRLCDEANEKLREALAAQKVAEENSEIEKFRALEMEQVGIDVTNTKEEEWGKELEALRNQRAADVAALLSTSEELQKVKQELAMTCASKNQALKHADDATKIAEIHAEKVEALSGELLHMKKELDSRIEMESKLASELKLEIDSLKEELEKAKNFEEKLVENEATLEQVNVDLEASKMAEFYSCNLVGELHVRVEDLTFQAEEANRLEKAASESLGLITKQLEENKELLNDAKSEIAVLGEKVGLLEISSERQKGDLEESECCLKRAKEEASEMVKKVEFLESELEAIKEEKTQALENEKLAEANLKTLLEEKNELVNELETSRDEEEKSKKALDSLASALHEVSTESREAKEKLISIQVEIENYETEMEDLKLVLKSTNEKYESMLEDGKNEINALTRSVEQSKQECRNLREELEEKEQQLMNSVKKSEEEKSHMGNEINRLINLLKVAEEEACGTREEGDRWRKSFKEADLEVVSLKGVIDEVKAEIMRLNENLNETENEFQKVLLENEDLRKREAISHEKIEELSKMLEDALAKKQEEENELTDSEKDYDVLPKVIEFSEQNGTGEEKPNVELLSQPINEKLKLDYLSNSGEREFTFENSIEKVKEKDNADSTVVDLKMWESCKIDAKDFSPDGEPEQESFEDDLESKTESGSDLYDQVNGVSSTENVGNCGSPPSKSSSQKKKKALLQKFGSLLKKKGSNNQK
ncbi:hypothetical protein ACS0TY_000411 [Phlomoides rotata]